MAASDRGSFERATRLLSWRGWEGNHFERIIIWVVEEPATMRQLVEADDVDIMDCFSVDFEWIDQLKENPALTVDLGESTEIIHLIMTVAGPLAAPGAQQDMGYAFPAPVDTLESANR